MITYAELELVKKLTPAELDELDEAQGPLEDCHNKQRAADYKIMWDRMMVEARKR